MVGVILALVGSLVQGVRTAAAADRGSVSAPQPLKVREHAPGRISAPQPPAHTDRPTQDPAAPGSARQKAVAAFDAEVTARQQPAPGPLWAGRAPQPAPAPSAQLVEPAPAGQGGGRTTTARTAAFVEPLGSAGAAATVTPAGSTYGVSYAPVTPPAVNPRYDTFGREVVKVTNTSALTWPAHSLSLDYHMYWSDQSIYNDNGIGTEITVSVPPGASVTVTGVFEEMPAGNFLLAWDLRRLSDNTFYKALGIPTAQPVEINVPHYAPSAALSGPLLNQAVDTRTPYLTVNAYGDNTQQNWVLFQVCPTTDTNGPDCVDSLAQKVNLPAGEFFAPVSWQPTLKWNQQYYWHAKIFDSTYPAGNAPWSPLSPFTVVVAPADGDHFGPGNADPIGVDLFQGNYSRTETDFSLPANGTVFSVNRTYNSANANPGVFGTGWSSVLDVRQVTDSDGKLIVTYPDGRQLRYGQNADGTWTASYGQQDEARSITKGLVLMPDGTEYTFTASGALQSVRAPGMQTVYLNYGGTGGKLSRLDLGTHRQLYVTWNATGQIASLSTSGTANRASGVQTWTYTYTANRLTSACNPRWDVSACSNYEYTGTGSRLSKITPPNGSTEAVTIGYETNGRTSWVAFADPAVNGDHWGYTKQAAVDPGAAFVVSVLQPTGITTSYQFGTMGQLLNRWHGGTKPTPSNNTVWTYGVDGKVDKVKDENQNLTWYDYDDQGHLASVQKLRETGYVVSTVYHYYGEQAGESKDPKDPRAGRITWFQDANRNTTTLTYNARGMLVSQSEPVGYGTADPPASTFHYTCEDTNWLAGSAPFVVDDQQDGSALQPCGMLASVTDAEGRTTRYGYDEWGEQTRITSPSGALIDQFYDGLGHLTRKVTTQPDGTGAARTDYTYDGVGHLLTETGPAVRNPVTGVTHQKKTTNGYDKDGNLLSSAVSDTTPAASGGDATRTTTYGYDVRGRQTTVSVNGSVTGKRTYDGDGNVLTSTDADGRIYEYHYDGDRGLLSTIAFPNWLDDSPGAVQRTVPIANYYYDPAGRVSAVIDPMGAEVDYTYTPDDLKLTESFLNFKDTPNATPRTLELHHYEYDDNGNVTKDTAGGTRVSTYTYNRADQRTGTTVDPGGLNRTSTTTYSPTGQVTGTGLTDGRGHTESTVNRYDPAGRLTRTAVHNDATPDLVTAYVRDGNGLPLAVTDPRGVANLDAVPDPAFTVTNAYDVLGRLSSSTAPQVAVEDGSGAAATSGSPVELRGYDTFGELTDVKDARGDVTHTGFDARGRRVRVDHPSSTEPDGTVVKPFEKWTYDGNGNVLVHTGRLGETSTTVYDARNRPLTVTTSAAVSGGPQGVTHYTWDDGGHLIASVSPAGTMRYYSYDLMGRMTDSTLTERYVDDGSGEASDYVSAYRWDQFGDLLSDSLSVPNATLTYNAAGEVATSTTYKYGTTSFERDVAGRLTKVTDPTGRHTDLGYDLAGRRTSTAVVAADGTVAARTAYHYDAAGNPVDVTDPNQHTWHADYDALGRLSKLTDPTPTDVNGTVLAAPTTSFGYDAGGNRTRQTDGNQHSTYTSYNAWDLPSVRLDPATAAHPAATDRTSTVSYNAAGEPRTLTQPGGVSVGFGYDLLGRVTSQSGSGAESATQNRQFGYDVAGRLTSLTSPTGNETLTWDDQDKLYAYTRAGLNGAAATTYQYEYDPRGQLSKRTGPDGTTTFVFDSNGQVFRSNDSLTGTNRYYTYDGAGRLTGEQDKNAANAVTGSYAYTYDALDHPLSQQSFDATGAQTGRIGYTWDGNGNQLTATGTGALSGQSDRSYRYDEDNRLLAAVDTAGGQSTETDYGWDGAGNRTSQTVSTLVGGARTNPVTTTAQYDERNRLLRTDSPTTSTSYQWKARGTLASVTSTPLPGGIPTTVTSSYDAFNQMIGDGAAQNGYDALGRLVQSGGSTLSYDGLESEPASDGNWLYVRDAAQRPVAAKSTSGTASSLLSNAHHDVIGTVDPVTGAATGTRSYGAFGERGATTGAGTPLGYQGGWTAASGKVDARSRWYDPSTGSFLSRDTAPGAISGAATANAYAYGGANPTSYYDPTGHNSILGSITGAFEDIVSGLGDVEAAGERIIAEAGGYVADALPEIAEAAGTALAEAGVDIAAGAACVVGCVEALVVGAVVVVVVSGVYYTLEVGADGSLFNEGATSSAPDPGPTPTGQQPPVDPPKADPGPPTTVQKVTTHARSTERWQTTTTWYDDTYLYTRTDKYVQTTVYTYVNGVQTGEPQISISHTWSMVAQLLVDLDHPIKTPTPKPGKPTQPTAGQGGPGAGTSCGNGGTPQSCLTPASSGPKLQTGGHKGGGGPIGGPYTLNGDCNPLSGEPRDADGNWQSTDNGVAEVANAIEQLYPGHVMAINVKFLRADGTVHAEYDIETQNSVIEVKYPGVTPSGKKGGGRANGSASKIGNKMDCTDKPVIVYGPRIQQAVINNIQAAGGLATNSLDDLLAVIAP